MHVLIALVALLALAFPALADSAVQFVSTGSNVTNCILVAPGRHQLSGMTMGNTGAAAWVKFYDLNSIPTTGASQGATPGGNPYVFPVPGATALAGTNTFLPFPLLFVNGIAMCATGGAANNDATALSASQVAGTILYQ